MSMCPNCKRRVKRKANRRKVRGAWIHKRCLKERGPTNEEAFGIPLVKEKAE